MTSDGSPSADQFRPAYRIRLSINTYILTLNPKSLLETIVSWLTSIEIVKLSNDSFRHFFVLSAVQHMFVSQF